MKHKILILFVLICGIASGQTISGYLKQNTKNQNLGQWHDSASGVTAYNGTPYLRAGFSTRSGQWGVDSAGHQFWFYSDTWLRLIKYAELADSAAAIRADFPAGGGGPTGTDFVPVTRSANAAEIVGANIELYGAGKNTPGVLTVDDKDVVNHGIPEWVGSATVANVNQYYDAFAWSTAIKGTIWTVFKRAATHVGNGRLMVMVSYDGGQNFDSINVLTLNGNDPFITAIGDTIFYAHTSGITGNIHIGYTLDGFVTKVLADSVDQVGEANYPFGKFIKKKSGKIAFLAYGVTATDYTIRIVESTDNGVSWDWHSVITQGTLATPINLNEADWDIVNDPTSDADTKIIMIARDEFLAGPQQWTSSDGYATWTYRGAITKLASADDEYGFPTSILKFGKRIYLGAGRRTNMAGVSTAPYFHIATLNGILDSVFTDPTKWSNPTVIHQSEGTYRGVEDYFNWGYTCLFKYGNALLTNYYDISPLNVNPNSFTMIGIIRVLGIYGVDLYAVSNQSIPDATATLVSTPIVRLDTDNSYNSVDGMVDILRSGHYDISGVATFASGTDGTYRRAYIEIVDPGETSINRIIAEKIDLPTNAPNFLRYEISKVVYLRAGERVRFMVIHDGGTGEELNNQGDVKYRSKLTIKIVK